MVSYNTNKTKTVLFSWACQQIFTKLLETKVRVSREKVYFKKKSYLIVGYMAK